MLRYTQEQPSFFFFFIKYKEFNIYFLFVLGIVQKWSMLAISAMVKKWPDLVCFYHFQELCYCWAEQSSRARIQTGTDLRSYRPIYLV